METQHFDRFDDPVVAADVAHQFWMPWPGYGVSMSGMAGKS